MNTIDKVFNDLKKKKQKAFVAYITAGDPDINSTLKIMQIFQRGSFYLNEYFNN